jgi:glucosyl-3-phosphoglycerate synthase
MNRTSTFRKIIVPVVDGSDFSSALILACAIASEDNVLLVGLVHVPEVQPLSSAAIQVRHLRTQLLTQANKIHLKSRPKVLVTDQPWQELIRVIQDEKPDMLILEWPGQLEALSITPANALQQVTCDIALVRSPIAHKPKNILVSLRGGPYAELALRMALSIQSVCGSHITSLHISPTKPNRLDDAAYKGLSSVLSHLPEIDRKEIQTDEPSSAILETSYNHDLIIVGARAKEHSKKPSIGPVAELVLGKCEAGVVVVKTARPIPVNMASEVVGHKAISILVDKWFAENTYHANEFTDLKQLLKLKEQQGISISLALPALNEEKTVGKIIETVKSALVESTPLLDEIVLVDSDSADLTRQIASNLGIPVYIHQRILSDYGARIGKGEALWKSLYVTSGDIVLWLDTDIVNIHPRFVFGLIGPLLSNPSIQFVKGFYRRPLRVGDKIQAGGGGRVTELTARPLINLFFPQLSGVIQPLSGEYGGRRSALEQLPFFSGYGVEIGLLIDVAERFGLESIAQVDLKERIHHNQPLEALSKMSFSIIQAVSRKLESRYGRNFLEDVNKSMKFVHYASGRFSLDVEEIAEQERPPMIEIPEYRAKFDRQVQLDAK